MLNLIKEMKEVLPKGRVHDNPALIDVYAIDASFYKPKAKLVVDAENLEDIFHILEVCRKHHMGVTFRGSGTGINEARPSGLAPG